MRTHNEAYYANIAASFFGAIQEFVLPSGKRVDLFCKTRVLEVDFVDKWAESIGQSLVYAHETQKEPAILFIYDIAKDFDLFQSILPVLRQSHIEIFTIDIHTCKIIRRE